MYHILKKEEPTNNFIQICECEERWLALCQAKLYAKEILKHEPTEPLWSVVGMKIIDNGIGIIVCDDKELIRLINRQKHHYERRQTDTRNQQKHYEEQYNQQQ